MQVLYLKPYYYPENLSSSYLGLHTQDAIIAQGWRIVLYAPTPSRGVNKPVRQYYIKNPSQILYDGLLQVYRFQLFSESCNVFLRALRYFILCVKFYFKSIYAAPSKNTDVVMVSSTPPILGLVAALIKKKLSVPVIYNLQDIFPDSLVGTGLTKQGSLLWKIGRVVENITYRNADRIIVISDDFKKNIMAKGVPEEKIVVVYNWVDENAVVPVAKVDNPLYDELGINRDKFSVVYAGNFGHAQNIDVTIAAAEKLKDIEDIQFLMFGTGGLVDDYKKVAQEKGLKNMFFFPLQPVDKVSQVYSLGNLGIVACKKGLGKGAFPSKTWSIMSAGTPVIANYDEDTDLERLVKDNGLGVFSAADDSEQMAERIMEMYKNRELCAEYGRNARQYILDNVSKDKSTQKYVDVIKEVVEERRNKKSKK